MRGRAEQDLWAARPMPGGRVGPTPMGHITSAGFIMGPYEIIITLEPP